MYDVIVVGARCAGAPTAMLLARAGRQVLVLERARFPRDTLSTHYLHLPAVARLADWSLLDRLRATGCPPMPRSVYEVADVRLAGSAPAYRGQDAAYAPRRHVLDTLLARAAAEAGAEVREGCTVTGLLRDADGRVTGVEYRDAGPGGTVRREHASLVVGADGMRSGGGRRAGAAPPTQDPKLTCAYYSYWEDLPADFELYQQPGRWVGALRTHDDATLVVTYFPQAKLPQVRADLEASYLDNIARAAPTLFERMRSARRVERIHGSADQQNFFRQAAGPGWALVGDAGHHKDSITARGITDAFFQADLLASAVAGILDDPQRLDAALKRYGKERDAALDPIYQGTLIVGQLAVQQDRLTVLRAIAGDQELVDRYFATVAGVLAPEDLYTPDLLALL
jgi:flavin-dependent dehydrogenase